MWEMITTMIERMATDRLWIYTGIAGSIFGAIFVAWIAKTRIGIWFYGKIDQLLNFLVERWGWTWFQQHPNAWRKKYPGITKKIDQLEERIRTLENENT